GGGGGDGPVGGRGGLGIVGVLVILGLAYFLGIDPRVILDQTGGGGGGIQLPMREGPREANRPLSPEEQELTQFTSVVLKTTEDIWGERFKASGQTYTPPKLVLFRGDVDSQCGMGVSQMGPFYCPNDGKVYVDLSFYDDLKNRFGASGDFAQAYVIAHEVGHHVQTLLGISAKVERARSRASERESNALQVRMELQADCLAGIWAHDAQSRLQIVEPGDIDEALNAAAAIGDDRIQRKTQGRVTPDSFTHGTSADRVGWFRKGFQSGQFSACDTFAPGAI
ncbi:KPN_02809 family neutral zinc metallopeptidase, partial [Rhodomicrobium vannielii]